MKGHSPAGALALLGVLGGVSAASAQVAPLHDVVHLGERYGTPVPSSFIEELTEDPEAFEFDGRGFGEGSLARIPEGLFGIFGQYDGNVQGTFHFPVLLGYFPESGLPAETRAAVQAQFFDGPNPSGTIGEYYDEASNGRVQLIGETLDWRATSLSQTQVAGGVSGLGGGSRVGQFILELLVQADDGSVDWGRYDNDGPDGIPNSGDDDGFVDVLGVVHPTHGGECGGGDNGNRIWSHRWSLSSSTGQSYVTGAVSANGGFIRANDYTIQPVRNCSNTGINAIGVFAHELGHGFGLPDLYGVGGAGHSGIGTWGLMGSGSYGCTNQSSSRPCLPGAWTRERLGWGTFVDLAPDTEHGTLTLRSPAESGAIYRYRVPGTSTYYLLEYRGRTSFDSGVHAEGLLVWQIDDQIIAANRRRNRVNGDPSRMGVWIRQADGRNQLGDTGDDGNRGDAGDPFPGSTAQTWFHAATSPASLLQNGDPAFLTITDITLGAGEVSADVSTASARLTLDAIGASGSGLFTLDGVPVGTGWSDDFAPFQRVDIEAGGGVSSAPGVRQGFSRWLDGPTERARTVQLGSEDVTLTAEYGVVEYKVSAALTGPVEGVAPGAVGATPSSPDFWFPAGTEIVFGASPYPGFAFDAWGGDLAGEPNPAPVTITTPLQFDAVFSLDFGIESSTTIDLVAGNSAALSLSARGSLGGTTWEVVSGALPDGVTVESDGRVTGAVLRTGEFTARVRVRDSRGLTDETDLLFRVAAPVLSIESLAGPILGTVERPTPGQREWLDAEGNRDGRYDIGDAILYLRRGGGS